LVVGDGFELAAGVGAHQAPGGGALLALLGQGQHYGVPVVRWQGVDGSVETGPPAVATTCDCLHQFIC